MTIEARCVAVQIPSTIKHDADWSRFGEPWDRKGPQMAEAVREQVRRDLIAKLYREACQKNGTLG